MEENTLALSTRFPIGALASRSGTPIKLVDTI
jgi:hypothetical protein